MITNFCLFINTKTRSTGYNYVGHTQVQRTTQLILSTQQMTQCVYLFFESYLAIFTFCKTTSPPAQRKTLTRVLFFCQNLRHNVEMGASLKRHSLLLVPKKKKIFQPFNEQHTPNTRVHFRNFVFSRFGALLSLLLTLTFYFW